MNSAPTAPYEQLEHLVHLTQGYYTKGWTPATSSNFSVMDQNVVWVTKSGLHKGFLKIEDFIPLTPEGNPLSSSRGHHKPSAETDLHLITYQHQADARVVLHTHSPFSTALSLATKGYELILKNHEIFKAFYGVETHDLSLELKIYDNTQDIPTLADQVAQQLQTRDQPSIPAFLIRGHGLYTWGRTLEEADRHLEAIEFLLHCEFLQRSLR